MESLEFQVKDNTASIAFPDWQTMLEYLDKTPKHDFGRGFPRGFEKSWHGVSSREEMHNLARNGWKEGLEHAAKLSGALFNRTSRTIRRRKIALDYTGMGFDIGKVVSGEPECWVRYDMTGHRKIVKIAYCPGISSGIRMNTLIARGAALASLIELLEFSGMGVELVSVDRASSARLATRKILDARVLVKRADQKLDMARIMFACAHAGFARGICFEVIETNPDEDYQIAGFGVPDKEIKEHVNADIVVGGAVFGDVQWDNPDSARKWIIEQLKEQGVHFNAN